MKALRNILSFVAIVSVMGVSAATYGTSHQPRYRRVVYQQEEMPSNMPVIVMSPMRSTIMQSGSALPLSAVTGTVLTGNMPGEYNPANAPGGGPRRIGGNTSGGSSDREDPYEDPIGDAVLPMLLLAGAYLIWRATRRRALSR